MHNKLFLCKVCGFDYGDYVWGEDGKTPSFEICPCCGTEFGYEDISDKSIERKREEWINNGAKWFSTKEKPDDWNLNQQLNNIGVKWVCKL